MQNGDLAAFSDGSNTILSHFGCCYTRTCYAYHYRPSTGGRSHSELVVGRLSLSPQSKYSCVTSVAQTLQEDPSCQLCSVLARYIQQTPLAELESELRARFLPDTTTLKQVYPVYGTAGYSEYMRGKQNYRKTSTATTSITPCGRLTSERLVRNVHLFVSVQLHYAVKYCVNNLWTMCLFVSHEIRFSRSNLGFNLLMIASLHLNRYASIEFA